MGFINLADSLVFNLCAELVAALTPLGDAAECEPVPLRITMIAALPLAVMISTIMLVTFAT